MRRSAAKKKMSGFSVHLYETRNFIIPVTAPTKEDAVRLALMMWRNAPTVADWEVDQTETDIVSVLEITS